MTQRWLISSDLDGTLLHPDGSLSENTIRTFEALHRQGHEIALASGRHWDHMTDIARQLRIPCYLIGSNGAWIGLANGEPLNKRTLGDGILTKLIRSLSNTQTAIIVTLDKERIVIDSGDEELLLRMPWAKGGEERIGDSEIFKLTVIMHDGMIEDIYARVHEAIGDIAKVCRTDARTMDINAPDVTKGQGITWLAAHLGCSLKHTVAFGNEMNDTALLSTARIGVAVEDANPDLFLYADERTVPSFDDGVALWLQSFFHIDEQELKNGGGEHERRGERETQR